MRVLATILAAFTVAVAALPAQQSAGSIDPPTAASVLLQAQGDGVQIYICTAQQTQQKWVLKAPDAKLLDASGSAIGTHFAGPTWKLTDGSQVQGELMASKPAPESGSIPWLLLRAKPASASGKLASVAFIRRTDTHGGVAPSTGCQDPADVGQTSRIPYTAAYTFYTLR
ncbi:MAG: DUF3455 domain-containing protein [Terracidiphilus sp.]|jgi:hypothetical protein